MEKGTDQKTVTHNRDTQLLTFQLDDREYALDISSVVQVVRMVAITQTPETSGILEGIINVRGRVVPVLDLRKRFSLRPKPYGLDNHLLIARSNGRTIALIVDAVNGVLSAPAGSLDYSAEISAQMTEYLQAVGKLGNRLLMIVNLESILGIVEEHKLQEALEEHA